MLRNSRLWRWASGSILLGAFIFGLCFFAKPGANLDHAGRRLMIDIFSGFKPFQPPPRPIFLMHGLGGEAADLTYLETWLAKALPGTKTFKVNIYERKESSTSLLVQVPALANFIRQTKKNDPDAFQYGYDLVCHSQGALICRCLAEEMDDHEVHTLISLAGPQMGVFGNHFSLPGGLMPVHLGINGDLGNMPYTQLLQKSSSVANMWNDPLHHNMFVEKSKFLAVFNGLQNRTDTDSREIARRKSNFVRLRKACFFVGDFGANPYEGGLEPWQSGVFGFYNYINGSNTEYLTMHQTLEYKHDTFGLRTLDTTGRLILQAVPKIGHGQWTGDYHVVSKYVVPQLGGQ